MAYFTNVSTSAILLKAPGLGEQIRLQNVGQVTVFVSSNASVTATTGFPLTPGSEIRWFNGYNGGFTVYGITSSSASTISIGTDVN